MLWVLICITAAYELNYFSSARLNQNKTLCDKVSYCSERVAEPWNPMSQHQGSQDEWLLFVPVYIIPAKQTAVLGDF